MVHDANGGCFREPPFEPHVHAVPAERYPGQLETSRSQARRLRAQKRPPLVYVSGPLTTGPFIENIRAGIAVGMTLSDRGYAVIVPHEKLVTELLHPHSYDEWLKFDFRLILCCDAVYRMSGASKGGDAEVAFAINHDVPVYTSLDTLVACHPVPSPSA